MTNYAEDKLSLALKNAIELLETDCERSYVIAVIESVSLAKALPERRRRAIHRYGKVDREKLQGIYGSAKYVNWLLSRAKASIKNLLICNGGMSHEELRELVSLYSSICLSLALVRRLQKAARQSAPQSGFIDSGLYKGVYTIFLSKGGDVVLVAFGAEDLSKMLSISISSARSRLSRCFPGKAGKGNCSIIANGIRYEVEFA